ncbi:hypothetical protein PVAND_002052 [Polypedilum vanderplanki]|uniref:Rrn7/TAF1B C-terminal cyclin domain-containing protein n=1 Tax=Polypedilum vanderplanki TaxID=319348 RepID=A0A9J6BQ48_POLVA|nr:hypothetical protein PVAND_002052 [Polypedilum vanderplanki]
MDNTEKFDEPCKNCGFLEFEFIDGHYYCIECDERFEDVAKKEIDEFAHENIFLDKKGTKRKDPNKTLEREREALSSKKTSYEEYNYILHGLVDEILQIEDIPGFKVTVLQLWIRYLKHYEAAFFDNDNLNHLPKLNGIYREIDAQILYNKKAKPKKTKKYYYKKKKYTEEEMNENTKEAKKLRRKIMKKSSRNLVKMEVETDISMSQASNSSSISTLSNLTFDDVTTAQQGMELAVEISSVGKAIRNRVLERRKNAGLEPLLNENGEPKILPGDLAYGEETQILRGRILLSILYSALNICGSNIQFGDLLRLCNQGYISYFNFRKFLPESLETAELSLQRFHSLHFLKFSTHFIYQLQYIDAFPDVGRSLRDPNFMMLVRRYVLDLSLPSTIVEYAEKIMDLIPSTNLKNKTLFPNYEGGAMAYIIFVLKYIFGIDGYREKEMSESARKINIELKKLNINEKLFVFEDWRESIEYRDVILNKYYYYPSMIKNNYKTDKPYKNFLSMLNTVKPMTFDISHDSDQKITRSHQESIERKNYLKGILSKVQKYNEENIDLRDELYFEWSFTPQKDAIETILKHDKIRSMLNQKLLVDYTDTNCNFYLNPDDLMKLFAEHGVHIKVKKCTFPKTFAFTKISSKMKSMNIIRQNNTKKLRASFEIGCDEETWKNNFKEQESIYREKKRLNEKIKFHKRTLKKVIERRSKEQKLIYMKTMTKNRQKVDEIIATSDEDSENDEYEEENDLIFIKPDFNLWHRKINKPSNENIKNYKHEFEKLPKSFIWLLEKAADVVNMDIYTLYIQFMIIEGQFVYKYKPLELTDYKLEERTNKRIKTYAQDL